MKFSHIGPRVFMIGAVYHAEARPYDNQGEKFYLVLGPSKRFAPNPYRDSLGPVEYEYLDLFTGQVDDFHRDSYFAEQAELFG